MPVPPRARRAQPFAEGAGVAATPPPVAGRRSPGGEGRPRRRSRTGCHPLAGTASPRHRRVEHRPSASVLTAGVLVEPPPTPAAATNAALVAPGPPCRAAREHAAQEGRAVRLGPCPELTRWQTADRALAVSVTPSGRLSLARHTGSPPPPRADAVARLTWSVRQRFLSSRPPHGPPALERSRQHRRRVGNGATAAAVASKRRLTAAVRRGPRRGEQRAVVPRDDGATDAAQGAADRTAREGGGGGDVVGGRRVMGRPCKAAVADGRRGQAAFGPKSARSRQPRHRPSSRRERHRSRGRADDGGASLDRFQKMILGQVAQLYEL